VLLKLHIDLESTWSIIIGALIAVALTFPMVMFINRYLPVLSGQKEAFNRISRALFKYPMVMYYGEKAI